MDYKYKVTDKNFKTFNPLEYTEEAMNYVVEDQREKSMDELLNETESFQKNLLGMEIEEADQQMVIPAVKFEDRVKATRNFAREQAAAVAKSHKTFGNSKEMQTIMRMVNGLNFLLEGDIPKTAGKIDCVALKERHLNGYEAAISACQYYLDTKTPKYEWSKKRYRRVENMKLALEKERELLEVVIANIGDQKYEKAELQNIKTPRDLLNLTRTNTIAGKAELQTEGNSTDVYKIKLTRDGKVYYFKQNLKPIGDDLPGFVKRRLRQLKSSEKNHGNIVLEENRLFHKIDNDDYTFAKQFLEKMDKSLEAVKDDIKSARSLKKQYLAFFAHDFDKVFEELDQYNAKANKVNATRIDLQAEIANAESKLKAGELPKNDADYYKSIITQNKKELKNLKALPIKSEYDWLVDMSKSKKNPLGITKSNAKDLFDVLKRMSEGGDNLAKTKGGNERIRRFLTRSMGKEFEAYGQQKERSNASEKEVMAKNNTATYRIANAFGFNDVITSSESAVVNIELVGTNKAQDVTGTISTEAPGLEMLKLVYLAEKYGKKIHYSPKAIRQLTRLQMFDTTCLQTDRHWRNFKCMTKPDLRNWKEADGLKEDIIIDSIGSYDHDMSFGNMDLDSAFINKENPEGESVKNGMLPPIVRKIKSDSVENSYYEKQFLKKSPYDILDAMLLPQPAKGSGMVKKIKDLSGMTPYKELALKDVIGSKKLESISYEMVQGNKLYKYNGVFFTVKGTNAEIRDKNGDRVHLDYMATMFIGHAIDALKTAKDRPDDFVKMISSSWHKVYDGIAGEHGQAGIVIKMEMQKMAELLVGNETIPGHYEIKLLSDIKDADKKAEVVNHATNLLKELENYDCSKNEFEGGSSGRLELNIRALCYYIKYQLNCLSQKDKNKILADAKKGILANKAAVREEYVKVPGMLHMDKEAYDQIKNMQAHFDDQVKLYLQDLGWEEDKIKAYKKRIDQQLLQIEECKNLAEPVLEQKYGRGHKLAKFFLEEKDYDEIKDIQEMAWDPGMSYFSTEDENYLVADDNYSMYLSNQEKLAKLEETNKHRKIERLHDLEQELTVYSTMISGKVVK